MQAWPGIGISTPENRIVRTMSVETAYQSIVVVNKSHTPAKAHGIALMCTLFLLGCIGGRAGDSQLQPATLNLDSIVTSHVVSTCLPYELAKKTILAVQVDPEQLTS